MTDNTQDRIRDLMIRLYKDYRELKGYPPLGIDRMRHDLENDSVSSEAFYLFLLEKVLPGIR